MEGKSGSHFLWTFTKKIYSLGLAKLRWLWFKYCSWIAREVLKKKCEFSNRLWRQNWLPCLLRDGLFCAWGYRNKKKTFKALRSNSSVPVPDTAGPQMAPEWHNPGSLPFLGEAGVLFNLFLVLSPCIFTDTSRPLSASPKVLCCVLSSWQVHWFASWSFQDRGMGLWLCFSGSSLALLATMHSPPQPLLEHCGCSWALSLEHNYRIHI